MVNTSVNTHVHPEDWLTQSDQLRQSEMTVQEYQIRCQVVEAKLDLLWNSCDGTNRLGQS